MAAAVEEVENQLKDRKWFGFMIGFGVRGTPEFTPLFEAAVNASREVSPQTRLMFPTGPDKIYEAIVRNLGVAGQA